MAIGAYQVMPATDQRPIPYTFTKTGIVCQDMCTSHKTHQLEKDGDGVIFCECCGRILAAEPSN